MIGARTIEQTLHTAPVISSQMEHAIQLWDSMYKGESPWLHEPDMANPTRIVSLGLPALIASEKARTALLEMNSQITTPTKEDRPVRQEESDPSADDETLKTTPETGTREKPAGNTARAEYLQSQYEKLLGKLRTEIEYGVAKGGLVIKPYIVMNEAMADVPSEASNVGGVVTNASIEFDFIQADCFYPLAFDASGKITEAAFVQTKTEKDIIYRRLEYHKWNNNRITVINKAYKSTNNQTQQSVSGLDLGHEIPLSEVPEWKNLKPSTNIEHVSRPLFAYFKMPEANTIDPTSPLGVSGYSRAIQLIKDADMQYSRLLWEYEAGEMAIDVDRDALNFVTGGHTRNGQHIDGQSVLNSLQSRLYRKIDLGESNTYEPYAPSLRDSQFIQGLNVILMRIEDVTGLSRGTLSDAAAEARTATELKILKQRSYQTNADIQQAIEVALKDVVYIMDVYCDLYKVTAKGEYDVSFEWDDSIIVDIDTELTRRMSLMQEGLVSKLENRMWYFGETEQQAKEALEKIEQEAKAEMENNIAMQSRMQEDDEWEKEEQ